MSIPILSIIGESGSGMTTLLEKLIASESPGEEYNLSLNAVAAF